MGPVLLYLGSVVLANALVFWFGIIDVFGVSFPAGAALAGLTFSFRDLVQQRFGKWGCWAWMMAAAFFSSFFSLDVAAASATAFLVSEGVDWAIFSYTNGTLRKKMFFSNLIGAPLDSLVFVPLVFGFVWPVIIGQAVIKVISSLAVLPFTRK